MPYRYLDDIATADAAFEAWGTTEKELFVSAADAVLNVMVENLDSIDRREERTIRCVAESRDMLLFHLLEEIIYFKDAEQLLLKVSDVLFETETGRFALTARVYGERIDPTRHELHVDVKAVTLYRFSLEQTGEGWKATVVLDI